MAKKESSFGNMTIALFVISAFAGLALSLVYSVTEEPIRATQIAKINNAIKLVISDFETKTDTTLMPAEGKDSIRIHRLFKDSVDAGKAVETYTDNGFSGRFSLMVGFDSEGAITNIEILEHKETPGLGNKMALPAFKNQFSGIKINELPGGKLKVKKDGGTIDAITAATISSRACCDAINRAYFTFKSAEKQ